MKTRRGRIQETSKPGARPIAAPKLDPRVPGAAAGNRSHTQLMSTGGRPGDRALPPGAGWTLAHPRS